MNTLKTLIAAAALATVSTATFAADDSPAAQRVQQSVSQDVVVGTAQQAPTGSGHLRGNRQERRGRSCRDRPDPVVH
ncbi:hypothetical protein [Cobetia sp. ICG0124]|uniref:hypothetical protein n=1 Tax=Cobetia sp. ICG0124 TaxID=2053669 RepID=UPI000FD81635|nr:hypothetical protein [Cobetia sp. ICG0124]AZV31528.1 hypothetical protein CU110_09380 [Cobetia sp. ICG0124]